MGKLIDANVILRYLLGDVPEQTEKAAEIIGKGAYTVPEVIAEVVYVLSGVYAINRKEICSSLSILLTEIGIANRNVVLNALKFYADENLDFVDAMLVSRAKLMKAEVFSFDKRLNKFLA